MDTRISAALEDLDNSRFATVAAAARLHEVSAVTLSKRRRG